MTKLKGHMGTIEFDGRFVRIDSKRFGDETVPIAAVNGVSIEPAGPGYRAIRISTAAAGSFKRKHTQSNMIKDPLALMFRKKHAEDFEALRDEIVEAMYTDA